MRQSANTVAMTDANQEVVKAYAYTPHGEIVNETGSIYQPFTYVGQYGVIQEPNGLYFMRARYYDSEVGRFISEDPIGFDGGQTSLYAYVSNNPIMFVDPSGLFRFGKRALKGSPWIPLLSRNPIDDYFNTEYSHEHGFFEDGSGYNRGYGPEGTFTESNTAGYRFEDKQYDDALMRKALVKLENEFSQIKYCLVGNNCQNFTQRWRELYHEEVRIQKRNVQSTKNH